ncbi:MAG TPA: STAS domain-containing protein [Burkholderiales bacterium]|nr:STAS domain-containing protein [Burkholderiales bacterium]
MQLTNRRIGNVVVLAATGRIDHASADGFKEALQPYLAQCKAGGDVLILDFSGIEYISSVGLRVLMLAAKQARGQQGAVAVAALQPVVREIFEISKFTLVIPCFAGVRDALAKLAPAALVAYGAA